MKFPMGPWTGFSGDSAGDCARVVAQPDGVDLAAGTMQSRTANGHPVDRQLVARADDDAVVLRLGAQDVERLGRGHAEPLALTDREVMETRMRADDLARGRDDLPGC